MSLTAALRADGDAVLFSVKCFIAAMLAYYVALSIGLNRPFWAVVTSYIIAQPMAGAVISKAAYRLFGTTIGGIAAVVLVPTFVNEPLVLAFALALWLAICIYISQLDRTPRAYAFLLSGYTAMIIGLPAVTAPGTVFDSAILRVQEITLGILSASLIHGVVFPVSVTGRLFTRIDAILAETRRWSIDSLAGEATPELDRERRRLATSVLELHQLSIHLPFDTARIVPRVRTVRALQDSLSSLLPLASAIEDRIAELRRTPAGLPPAIETLIARIARWIERDAPTDARDATGIPLIAEARALEPFLEHGENPHSAGGLWHDMLTLNLLARLAELVETLTDVHDVNAQLRTHTVRPMSRRVADLLAATSNRPLHLDRRFAIRAAAATLLTIMLGCVFWIATAWKDGVGAVLIAGIACALFGGADNPRAGLAKMQIGSTIGLVAALFYAYTIFPRVTDFVTLAAAMAPALLIMGVLMGKPGLTPIGTGILIGFPQSVGLYDRYIPNFAASVNGAIAQFIGIGFAIVALGLFLTVGAGHRYRTLARAGWRDVARRARGDAPDSRAWTSLMLDRVGLMLPATMPIMMAGAIPPAGTALIDALRDMRTGNVAGDLHALRATATPPEQALIDRTLAGVAAHFAALDPAHPANPDPALLTDIDAAARTFAADAGQDDGGDRRRAALILLASLRRNLFPDAHPHAIEAAA